MNRIRLSRPLNNFKTIVSFPYIKGNARALLVFEPVFAIIFSSLNYFYPLYMQALGLSKTSIGLVASIGAAFALVFSLVSGYITDRLGRKKTLRIFDTLAWTIPFLIWAVAQNFWYFLIAIIFNNTVKIAAVGFICLIVDDTDERDRTSVFTVLSIIGLGAGLFTPITGRFINSLGLIPTIRGMYFAAFVYMVFMVILRDKWTVERQDSQALSESHKSLSVKDSLKQYRELLRNLARRPSILVFLLMFAFTGFQGGLLLFRIIYLKDVLQFTESIISILPFLSSFVMLGVYIFIIPVLKSKNKDFKLMWIGGLISAAGSLLFVTAGLGAVGIMAASLVISAFGDALASPFKQSSFSNMIDTEVRAKTLSIEYTLTALCTIPSGVVAGMLFKMNPVYPFILSLIFVAINFVLCLYISTLEAGKKYTLEVPMEM